MLKINFSFCLHMCVRFIADNNENNLNFQKLLVKNINTIVLLAFKLQLTKQSASYIDRIPKKKRLCKHC